MTATVNRYLEDKAMDHIDHALGRPVDPLAETYRNYFATCSGAEKNTFRQSAHWQERFTYRDMVWFGVTQAGREALAAHLKAIGDPYQLYEVTTRLPGFGEHTTLVAAKSRSAARYSHYLDVADALSDLTFGEFCRCASVRRAPMPRIEGRKDAV